MGQEMVVEHMILNIKAMVWIKECTFQNIW